MLVLVAQSCPTLSDPIARQAPLCWDFPGKNTGVGYLFANDSQTYLQLRPLFPQETSQICYTQNKVLTSLRNHYCYLVTRLCLIVLQPHGQ